MINGSTPSWPTSDNRRPPRLRLERTNLRPAVMPSLRSISRRADTDFDSHILPALRTIFQDQVRDNCIGKVDLQLNHSAVTSELVNEPVYNVSFFSRGLRRGPT
jgi:hypothetical protein